MCCVVPFAVSKSKSSHEDAGQDQGKFDSGSRRGGDPCSLSHRLRVERAEPFAEGLALGFELDGRRPGHTRARRSAATAWDPSLATAWVPSAATALGASAATALRHRGARLEIFFILTNKRHSQQLKRLMRTPDMR